MNKELDKGLCLLKQAARKAKIYEAHDHEYEVHDAGGSNDSAYLRAEAYAALVDFRALVSKTRTDAMFEYEGVSDKLSAHDSGSNTVSSNHYMLALNALESASLHLSSALLTLGE